jgi:hypothetical protein
MPVTPFYSDNRLKCWPFLEPSVGNSSPAGTLSVLPKSAVVDAGFVMGPRSQFQPSHLVFLHRVYQVGNVVTFDVRASSPGMDGRYRWLFSFTDTDPAYSLAYGVLDRFGGSEDACGVGGFGDAYLVVGDLSAVLASLSGGQLTAPPQPILFEPGTIQSSADRRLLSLSVANVDRTRVRPTPECDPDFGEPAAAREIYVVQSCITGRIWLGEGYNASVQQDTAGNLITVAASAGAGQGPACEEILLYPEEVPPEGSELLTGGPSCQEVLSSINGLTGENIPVFSGAGVTVTPDSEAHRLLIRSDMSGLLACSDSGG